MIKTIRNATGAMAAGLVLAMTAAGFATPAAHAANGVQPVTFTIAGGALALAQTPDAPIALVAGTAVNMPVTTVTDGRNDTGRTALWTVTATASDLVAATATITADQITLAQSGSFTSGTGTVTTGGLVSATGDSIDSVYTYTPTATLAPQSHPNSGSYTGTVTQTVV